jgi:hypothetical protein
LTLWKITGDRVIAPSSGNIPITPQDVTLSPFSNHTYKLEVGFDIDRDGSLQTSEVTHTMTIKILNVKVLAENAGGAVGAVPLTECMYNRLITYTAKIPVWTSFDGSVTYRFRRTVPRSIFAQNGIMTSTETVEASSASITAYPGDFKRKKYTTKTVVTVSYKGVTATSSPLYIDLYKPNINKFKDHIDQKDWMICVGRNIEYEANASSDCQNFAWDLKSGTFFDYWQITGGNAKSGTSMLIPLSELEAASGTHFGDTYGNVRVQFKDGDNNSYSFESTDMNPSQKAKVFFPRDYMLNGAACPAWFKFWASDQGGPGIHRFSGTSTHDNVTVTWKFDNSISGNAETAWVTYKKATISLSSRVVGAKNLNFVSPRYPTLPIPTFNNSSGSPTTFPVGTISLSFVKADHESIDCAIKTSRHELQHTKRCYLLKTTSVSDPDDDWLSNSFEDSLGTNWNQQTTYTSFYLTGFDDEIDCEKEAQTPMPNASASQDWSYPGKQWH